MLLKHLAASADRRTCVLSSLAVLTLLLGLGYEGLRISLSDDDLMNLHFGTREPLARLILANLFPFTTVFRPAGSALYVAMFKLFGFDPIYYRLVLYGILLLGCVALYRLVKDLDGRVTAAALAPIFIAFHSRFLQIYTDNGFLYDPLCAMFFVATVIFYRHRRVRGPLRAVDVLILYLLWAAAVNAKEVGLTLPAVLIAYEVVFARPLTWRTLTWPCVLLCLSFAAWRGKIAEGSPLHAHHNYQPSLDPARLLGEVQRWTAEAMLSSDVAVSIPMLAGLLILLGALVLASRSKAAFFGLLWAFITPLPVLTIGGRPFSSSLVAWMGIAMVLASVLAEGLDRLRLRESMKTLVVAAVALCWGLLQWKDASRRPSIQQVGARWEHVRDAIADYSRLPKLCQGNNVLVLDSRFGADRYHPLFLIQLICGRPEMAIHIPGLNITRELATEKFKEFDIVLLDRGRDVEVVRYRTDP